MKTSYPGWEYQVGKEYINEQILRKAKKTEYKSPFY